MVQIVAEGSFVDPEVGLQLNAAGSGSGFIIDESGIAVTNNHVVTGAALLRVFVGGEEHNAKILGVSECSDLAVIDIDGDDFPYLEWYEQDIAVGLEIYAAGYPLGDPEFTLTRGVISKAQADGESSWASVDSVVEHDATINPGSSGGPLVTNDGNVVGVNYAGSAGTGQFYAITREEALGIITRLRNSEDVTSIGVNGEAVLEGDVSGIWVASVEAGSPADVAGVRPGDIITRLQGLVLATDGTMADYCDILRTHRAGDTMNIEVLRYETQEVLAGQLNGRALEPAFSFAQTLGEEVETEGEGTDAGATYAEYQAIQDDSGSLVVEVPAEWSDTDGSAWELEGEVVGVSVAAAPNLDGYYNTWTTPGVFFGASERLVQEATEEEILDLLDFSADCSFEGRDEYDDGLYTGYFDVWSACGDGDTVLVVISSTPEARDFITLVIVQVVSDADLDALDRILGSFIVQ